MQALERAATAAATPIAYQPAQLLQLIAEHLRASGLEASADCLSSEAGLTPSPQSTAASDFAANSRHPHPAPPSQPPAAELRQPSMQPAGTSAPDGQASCAKSGSQGAGEAAVAGGAEDGPPAAKRRRLSVAPRLHINRRTSAGSVSHTPRSSAAPSPLGTPGAPLPVITSQPHSIVLDTCGTAQPRTMSDAASVTPTPSDRGGDAAWLKRQSPVASASAGPCSGPETLLSNLPRRRRRGSGGAMGSSPAAFTVLPAALLGSAATPGDYLKLSTDNGLVGCPCLLTRPRTQLAYPRQILPGS